MTRFPTLYGRKESWFYLVEGSINTCFSCFYSTNGQYVKQGKFGAAVLGNHTAREVRLPPRLMYIHMSQIISEPVFIGTCLMSYISED